ncbi:MAG: hypothetical protein CMIDDMOC_00320 [Sodalis sp. Fle]|nr:MAG: hypothetical protein CMIDDMOC_00320 [Sodalis sp. Fle]
MTNVNKAQLPSTRSGRNSAMPRTKWLFNCILTLENSLLNNNSDYTFIRNDHSY